MSRRANILFIHNEDLSFDFRFVGGAPSGADPLFIIGGDNEFNYGTVEVDGDDADLFHFSIPASALDDFGLSFPYSIQDHGNDDEILLSGTALSRKYQNIASGTTAMVDLDAGEVMVAYTSGGITVEGGGGGGGEPAAYTELEFDQETLGFEDFIKQDGSPLPTFSGFARLIETPTDNEALSLMNFTLSLTALVGTDDGPGDIILRLTYLANFLHETWAVYSNGNPRFSASGVIAGLPYFGWLDPFSGWGLVSASGSPIADEITAGDEVHIQGTVIIGVD